MVNIDVQQGAGTSYILLTGGSMLVLTLHSVLCTVAVVTVSSRVAAGMARDKCSDVFEKVVFPVFPISNSTISFHL
ncbi:MAG: hypothetical protein NTZ74_00140 [Chloroflexi bacterium]|nr:hypothetical protein [Chloroflexota bacterium]